MTREASTQVERVFPQAGRNHQHPHVLTVVQRAGRAVFLPLVSALVLAACQSGTPTAIATSPRATPSASGSSGIPGFDHIAVIVMENHGYQDVIDTPATPYLSRLAHQNGLATQYYAVGHPSLGQYLALTTGGEHGNPQGCDPAVCPVAAANLADRVERSGREWRAYMESMGSPCRLTSGDGYDVHHNPWIYLNDIRTHGTRCATHVLDLSQLGPDLASTTSTPGLLWITPNDCHDMHSCSPAAGDAWLSQEVPMILGSPAFTQQNSLLVVMWDEDDFTPANHVAAILVAPKAIRPGAVSAQHYTHYSLLRTIEAAWGLAPLTDNDGGASPMSDLFR